MKKKKKKKRFSKYIVLQYTVVFLWEFDTYIKWRYKVNVEGLGLSIWDRGNDSHFVNWIPRV